MFPVTRLPLFNLERFELKSYLLINVFDGYDPRKSERETMKEKDRNRETEAGQINTEIETETDRKTDTEI